MKKSFAATELQEPDTVFGTGKFTTEDIAAREQFMQESRQKPENIAAVEAIRQRTDQVVVKHTGQRAKIQTIKQHA
ncbi:MAG: hypothetical protein ACRYG7_17240 [Janthinobacterium lividum]